MHSCVIIVRLFTHQHIVYSTHGSYDCLHCKMVTLFPYASTSQMCGFLADEHRKGDLRYVTAVGNEDYVLSCVT